MNTMAFTASAVALCTAAGIAAGQSDPASFGTVYNIGTFPPGSVFDVSGAVTGASVGDGNGVFFESFITPTFLGGDTLGSDSQLNVFDGGEVRFGFSVGLPDGSVSNAELNVLGGVVALLGDMWNGTLNVFHGTVGSDFRAAFSTINVSGGTVEPDLNSRLGIHTITGGTIGERLDIDGINTISGGAIGSNSILRGTTTITGGSVGDLLLIDGIADISGGTIGGGFSILPDSTVNISGGTFGDAYFARASSVTNLFGTSFFLDGVELTDLVLDEEFVITDRDVTLSGTLADGSAFEFDLNSSDIAGEDFFFAGSSVTVTLVPAPGAAGALAIAGLFMARRRR